MKNLFLIGGTMGIGKTTTCQIMKRKLNNSIFLDGDWCWDMHQQAIIDDILSRLDTANCSVHAISLVCSEQALQSRLKKDIDAGIREKDVIRRSIERLPLYGELDTYRIDVSEIGPDEAASLIMSIN